MVCIYGYPCCNGRGVTKLAWQMIELYLRRHQPDLYDELTRAAWDKDPRPLGRRPSVLYPDGPVQYGRDADGRPFAHQVKRKWCSGECYRANRPAKDRVTA